MDLAHLDSGLNRTVNNLASSEEVISSGEPRPSRGGFLLVASSARMHREAGRAAARDFYDAPRFVKRRLYAEQSGRPWYILSPEHGLLHPDDVIEPSDFSSARWRLPEWESWSARVAEALVEPIASMGARSVEVLAGGPYLDFGLREGLEGLGLQVLIPHRLLSGPEQSSPLESEGRPEAPPAEQPAPPSVEPAVAARTSGTSSGSGLQSGGSSSLGKAKNSAKSVIGDVEQRDKELGRQIDRDFGTGGP